jgi:hypothetical protein
MAGLKKFIEVSLKFIDHSIATNKKADNLYHAYNLMTVDNENEVSISHLSEMLEGQVAVLSSGFLTSNEALEVLDALKSSSLFRQDQYSYILYPNKDLPKFLNKNTISNEVVSKSELLTNLIAANNTQIIKKDCNGNYHFNGNFKNAADLEKKKSKFYTHLKPFLITNHLRVVQEHFTDMKVWVPFIGTWFQNCNWPFRNVV